MSTWLMNALFRRTATSQKLRKFTAIDQILSVQGAQTHLKMSLDAHEKEQRERFKFEHIDHKSKDFIQKAQARAINNLQSKAISLPEYFRVKHMINDLKKVRFAANYDGYKVKTDVGGTKERELIQLFERLERNKRGDFAYMLTGKRVEKDPQADGYIGNL